MVGRYTRLKVRHKVRTHQKRVVELGHNANRQLDRHIFRRWHNLRYGARFAIGWLLLVAILVGAVVIQIKSLGRYYLAPQPVAGGIYTEGIVGTFSNASPIYATSDIDTSVSKLVFSSLLTYDQNNRLVGSLAKSWQLDDKGTTYTVKLKDNLRWHDNQPLMADDIVFTYQTIQNPDAKSPYLPSYKDVKVTKIDNRTIQFILPVAYSPFLHSLTNGIIPQHILKNVPMAELRSHLFNNKTPIGSGPFKFSSVVTSSSQSSVNTATIQLASYTNYHLGKPKLDGITLRTYKDAEALKTANKQHKVITAAGLDISDQVVPTGHEAYSFNLMSANMLFLKTTSTNLGDASVRKALLLGTDTKALVKKLGYPVILAREPILKTQTGYNPALQQASFDKKQAIQLLNTSGWVISGKQHYRTKNGKALILRLTYQNNHDFSKIAQELQRQWADIGVNLTIEVTPDDQVGQRILDSHDYDVLLYGINIGADPDVYAYWHSSQINAKSPIHLNLSEYKSSAADLALESARSRQDVVLRAAKYKLFLEAWQKDVPAIGLYQPRYLYVISHQHIYGLDAKYINTPSDRFNNVQQWMIKTKPTKES